MKVLVVANYNTGKFSPFVVEQVDSIRTLGVEFDFFGIVGKGWWGYLKNLPALKRKIKAYKPDLIHAHYGLSGLLATLQTEVPVVITFHNGETLSTIPNYLSSIAAKRAVHVIYVAKHIRELSKFKARSYDIVPCGITPDDISIIPFGIARQQLQFSPQKKYILFGGAFSNLRKNYSLLKKAVKILSDEFDIECIEMRGLNREQINLLMSAVDCFALPTKSEGSPQALKEAMFCNCPIVATDVADIKHLLGDVEGHYICSFDENDVAQQLRKALLFKGRTAGRERIMQLGLTNNLVAKKILSIYNNISNLT